MSQELLRHKDVKTTIIYTYVLNIGDKGDVVYLIRRDRLRAPQKSQASENAESLLCTRVTGVFWTGLRQCSCLMQGLGVWRAYYLCYKSELSQF